MARSLPSVQSAALTVAIFAAATSCGIDDRSLQGGSGGASAHAGRGSGGNGRSGNGQQPQGGKDSPPTAGESASGGMAVAGEPGGSGASGNAGNGGSAPMADGCGDLNENDVPDCDETRVLNATFDAAAAEWLAEPTLEQAWDDADAFGKGSSGALALQATAVMDSPGSAMIGSRQCLVAEGDKTYDFAAQLFLDGSDGGGKAGINVWFYSADGCQGGFLNAKDADLTFEADAWTIVRGSIEAPSAARSMLVRLVTVKPYPQPKLRALFDNVLVVEQAVIP